MASDDPPDFDTTGANAILLMGPEERAALERRFWAMTEARPDPWDKDAPPETWCLWWTGGRSGLGCGYGSFSVRGVKVGAHCVAYVLAHGPIPKEMKVRHSCHNRLCVLAAHLTVGTAADNARDTVRAGRTTRGRRPFFPKLTREDDEAIHFFKARGQNVSSLAEEFDVDPRTIRAAVERHARRLAAAAPEGTPEPPGDGETGEGEAGKG